MHVTERWREDGVSRYDYAVFHPETSGDPPTFVQVFGLYMLCIGQSCGFLEPVFLHVGLGRILKFSSRNKLTLYPELKDEGIVKVFDLHNIARPCHIVPPWSQASGSEESQSQAVRFTAADLVDGDMYLRLHHL